MCVVEQAVFQASELRRNDQGRTSEIAPERILIPLVGKLA
jgi:hypothetical protein